MYFITTMSRKAARCVGYFSNIEDAIDLVKNNSCDINEAGYYPYVVIENIAEGIYQYDSHPVWFKYNDAIDEYEKSDRPDFIDGWYVGFGIG